MNLKRFANSNIGLTIIVAALSSSIGYVINSLNSPEKREIRRLENVISTSESRYKNFDAQVTQWVVEQGKQELTYLVNLKEGARSHVEEDLRQKIFSKIDALKFIRNSKGYELLPEELRFCAEGFVITAESVMKSYPTNSASRVSLN